MGGHTQELRNRVTVRGRVGRVTRALAGAVVVFATAMPAAGGPVGEQAGAGNAATIQSKEHRPLGAPGPGDRAGAQRPAAASSGAPSAGGGLTRTAISLAVVLGLIWLCAAGAKRFLGGRLGLAAAIGSGGRSPAGLIEVLGRYPVGRGQALVLLKLDRRVLLLSQTGGGFSLRRAPVGGGLTTLCEVSNPDEVASILIKAQDAEGESISARFNSLLSEFGDAEDVDESPVGRRRVVESAEGDRAELVSRPNNAGASAGTKIVPARRAPTSLETARRDAVDSLHARLGAMRSATERGGA
jgi:hypothetical protein